MTTDTPRTDAAQLWHFDEPVVPKEFAKQLERELAHSLENQVKSQAQSHGLARRVVEAEMKLEVSQAEVERLTSALASCWHAANTYDGNYTRACDNVMKISSEALSPNDK